MGGSYDRLLTGRTPDNTPTGAVGGLFTEGVIDHLDLAGMWVTIPSADGGRFLHGPCPWNQALVQPGDDGHGAHTHNPTVPGAGAACLLVWVNGLAGVRDGRWWVVAWWQA